MSTLAETVVAPVVATESEAKVEDLNIDDAAKASKLAALKGDCGDVSGAKDETQQSLESSNNSHTNGSTNGTDEKFGENGDTLSESTSPNQDASKDNTGGAKNDDGSETEMVSSSEAVQDATETTKVQDQSEDSENMQDDSKANDTASPKVSKEDSTDQKDLAAPAE